jgi:dolichol-phosphate mannosyltransferase
MVGSVEKKMVVVIIPAYQAENTITNVIDNIPGWVSTIVVVNDCSGDHTREIVENLNHPRVCLINLDKNQGVGGAMKLGYKKALELDADIIVKMDSDGQMDPHYLIPLITPILKKKADYSKGNRFLNATELNQMPAVRRMGNMFLSFLTKLSSGYWTIFDPTNGYTAISRNALSVLELDRLENRYFFETSMLMELYLHRIAIRDVLIPAKYNGEKSSLSEVKSLFEFPPKLAKGLLRRIYLSYFLKDFNAISMLLSFGLISLIFGMIWGIVYWVKSAITEIPASTGTVMIAVLPIILGIQFILQAFILDIQNVPTEVIEE